MKKNLVEDFINQRYVVALVGPTAIGKTSLALRLSNVLPMEIISADSRQIYKFMDIGTAKPSQEEREKVPHHFIDICNPDEYYSAGQFAKDAWNVIDQIFAKSKLPFIVGGSGLYIKALCEGIFEEDFTPEEKAQALKIRKELSFLSKETLYAKLLEVDPDTAKLYPDKNQVRLIRALEFYFLKGVPISFYRRTFHKSPNFKPIYLGLTCSREKLYAKIEQRVDLMWQMGLVEEVQHLLDMGYNPRLSSLNTVGYKETIDFLNKKLSQIQAIELIKRNTRRYAKRQITWFNKNTKIRWFDVGAQFLESSILKFLVNYNANILES
ncbi:MAG: tRNA (adenosine(37)-N6)-dimethylallyltransferase MiaA [Candidatus Kapaibacteriota bacterium]